MYQLTVPSLRKDSEKHLLKGLVGIFNQGIRENKLTAALKSLEILAQKFGFFTRQEGQTFDLSETKLEELLKFLKTNYNLADEIK